MLLAAKLPKTLWAEAASHFVWLRNRVPTKAVSDYKTPIQMSTGNSPDSPKLESKVEKGRFIGFDEESKGYRIYWEEKRSVTVERDVYRNPIKLKIVQKRSILQNLRNRTRSRILLSSKPHPRHPPKILASNLQKMKRRSQRNS